MLMLECLYDAFFVLVYFIFAHLTIVHTSYVITVFGLFLSLSPSLRVLTYDIVAVTQI